MEYNSKLEELFDRWIAESEKHQETKDKNEKIIFTKDGIMRKGGECSHIDVEKEWSTQEKRIMFILKDQPTNWSDDTRNWLVDEKNGVKNRMLKPRFIKNIANIFWGLNNASKDNLCDYSALCQSRKEVEECFNTIPFAFIESKKQGGKTSISNKILHQYLDRYGEFLKEEINILKPSMIVCTSPIIYNFVITQYFSDDELEKIDGHNSIRIYIKSKTLIFCSYHPSARKSEEQIYNGVMSHYRAYLTK